MAQPVQTENWAWVLIGVSKIDLATPVTIAVNPITGAVLVELA